MNRKTIGIDIGGTSVRTALVTNGGEIISHKILPTEPGKGPEKLLEKLKIMIEDVRKNEVIDAIGVGCPGPLNPYEGIILDPPNLTGWRNVPFRSMLENELKKPVVLDNDANAAALGEAKIGAGKSYDSVFYITVSTGIGGGIVINNKIFHGAQGNAGEIGNMIVEPSSEKVSNLNAGALETLASGTAIGNHGKQLMQLDGGAKEVFDLMEIGNREAYDIVERAMTYLSIGIGNLANCFNPAVFVLGGGVMEQPTALAMVETKVKDYLYESLKEDIVIKKASLGKDAGVIGAAMLPNA
ncbi:ROK family protein [Evansella halocellulosilytica]|uniref:ROK family protein n=1 Tax=Evansella halocellulosilytica TaxID=2011013 RepID=UPI000BB78CCB|nr:ROK family protein [Evansella halocellulosilytica]